jgi:molybdopterin-guanine dinucleotide biosynthesis protein A
VTLIGNNRLNGLILIGGGSTRMQQDKSTLHYHGPNQRDHLISLLTPLCSQVFLSCNATQASELTDTYNIIPDKLEGVGPIGGIQSAFDQYPTVAWLVVACDLPLLTPETLYYLITHRQTHKQATAFRTGKEKYPEPLLAIYEPAAYPVIRHEIEKGQYSPSRVLSTMDVAWLEVPNENDLKNVNDPEGYRRTLEEIRSPLK